MFLFDWRYQSRLGAAGFAVAIGVAYFMAAWLGLAFRIDTETSVFWPAAGIAVGALIVWGPGTRLPVAAGVLVATAAANLMIGRNGWLSVAFGIVNVGQALLTAILIERWFGRSLELGNVPQVLGFLAASAIGSAVGAVGAAVVVGLIQSTASPFIVWRIWFASCLLGMVTVAPLLVGTAEAVRQMPPRRELIEGAVGVLMLAVSNAFVISLPQGAWSTALPVVIVFPLLLWIAARCRPMFAGAAVFVVAFAVIWSITFSVGPFGDASIPHAERKLAAQTVVLAGALLTLVLAALFAERRHSEVVLKQSERRLQVALDGAELGAFSADLATGRFECDARTALIHGHNVPPTTIRESRRFVHPQDRIRIDAALAEAQRTGGIWNAEYRVEHPAGHPHAGETRWVAVEGSIVRDPHGAAAGLLGVTRDITERKRTERALAERSLQLAIAGKSARVGSFAYDVDTEKMQISAGYAAIHGFPDGTTEIARTQWQLGVHPEDLMRWEELRSRAFRERWQEYSGEYRLVGSSGEVRWIEARVFVSYGSDGRAQRAVGVDIDITERKNAELTLADRDMQLAIAGKIALVGTFACDVDTGKMQISAGYAAIHGFPDGTTEIARSRWRLGLHPEDLVRWEEIRSRCFREQLDEYGADYRIVRSEGDVRWIDARCFVSYHGDGRPKRVVGVNIDVTERKRAEEHHRAMNTELDHRVKNMLATVSAIIVQTPKVNSSLADYVAGLDERIKSLARTHELLSHRRWHGVSLEEIVRRELAPYLADNAGIGGPCVTLKAEAAQALGIVLHELATNAAKHGAFSRPVGRLSLQWRWLRNGSSGRLAIEWQELGGPPVREPTQPGYGISVVRELIPFELGGTADLDFATNGFHCRMEIPADWVRKAGQEDFRGADIAQVPRD